jgi:putative phage-type endonuclease
MSLQRTPEWYAARLGHATASRATDILATIKSGEAAARRDYRTQLVVERLTGKPAEDVYISADMQRGIDHEPLAREAYEAREGVLVEDVGFVHHPDIAWCGASPDGFIGTRGLEIKCPRPATHLRYIKEGRVPPDYLPQVAMQAACAKRDSVDFVSYCDIMPPRLQLFVVTWAADPAYIAMIEEKVRQFLDEVEAELRQFEQM